MVVFIQDCEFEQYLLSVCVHVFLSVLYVIANVFTEICTNAPSPVASTYV